MAKTLPAVLNTERVKDQNQPIELYVADFPTGVGIKYYAAHDTDVAFFDPDTAVAKTYEALGIQRTPIRLRTNLEIDQVSFQFDNVDRSFSSIANNTELQGVRVRILKVFGNALSGATDFDVRFDGLIDRVTIGPQAAAFSLVGRIGAGTLAAKGPRRNYQNHCNWRFTDSFCTFTLTAGVNQKTGLTADATTTTTKIVDAALTEAAGFWKHGVVTITSGASKDFVRRIVVSSVGSVELDFPLPTAPSPGDTYDIEIGCGHTREQDCTPRFSNDDNFGGFVNIPQMLVIR